MPPTHPQSYVDDRVYVSIEETRRLTGLGRTKIYELIRLGRLSTKKIGKRRLVVRQSISAL